MVPAPERALARRLLILVGAGYLLTQLVLLSPHRGPSWDEAIYLSQVAPHMPALAFSPSRARGITLLVAPVLQLGGSLAAVRMFLAVASAAALTLAFWTWAPITGLGAPLAGFLFGFSWLGLFYGSEVMPNLWASILGVAVVGLVARRLAGDGWPWNVPAAAVLLGLMALFRPPDALVAAAAVALYVALFRREAWRVLVALGVGLALGWLPWVVEMSVRYGGPVEAFRQASGVGHVTAGGVGSRVLQQLALTDGPVIGPQVPRVIPVGGLLWWGGLVVLSAVALIRGRRMATLGALSLATLTGVALAVEYLVFVSGLAPRFLSPAYALLVLPTAWGLVSLVRGGAVARAGGYVALALVVVWGGWQVVTADRIETDAVRARASVQDAGLAVRGLAEGRPCLVASTEGYPQIAYAARCAGKWLHGVGEAEVAPLSSLAGAGDRVFVVLPSPPPPASPLAALEPRPVPTAGVRWLVYELPT
jgi:hypothetical protein